MKTGRTDHRRPPPVPAKSVIRSDLERLRRPTVSATASQQSEVLARESQTRERQTGLNREAAQRDDRYQADLVSASRAAAPRRSASLQRPDEPLLEDVNRFEALLSGAPDEDAWHEQAGSEADAWPVSDDARRQAHQTADTMAHVMSHQSRLPASSTGFQTAGQGRLAEVTQATEGSAGAVHSGRNAESARSPALPETSAGPSAFESALQASTGAPQRGAHRSGPGVVSPVSVPALQADFADSAASASTATVASAGTGSPLSIGTELPEIDHFELTVQTRDVGQIGLYATAQPGGWHVRLQTDTAEQAAWLAQRAEVIARGLSRDLRCAVTVEVAV